jgi:AcrR family transcriptional regulator
MRLGQAGFKYLPMGRPKEVSDEQIIAAARRCFLERGAGVSAIDIGREFGVSHTTIFNRFGSKEALMVAALGPPEKVPWVSAIEQGPDDRPIRDQLVEHCTVISAYFQKLQFGLAVLQAAGISVEKILRSRKGEPPPAQAFRALTAWLTRIRPATPGEVRCRNPGRHDSGSAAQLGLHRTGLWPFDDDSSR